MLAVRPTFQVNSRGVGLTATILLHALLLAVLLSQAPVRNAMRNAAPIIVSLIRTPKVEKPVQPPKPLPQRPSAKPIPQRMAPVPMPVVDIPAPATFQTITPDDAKPAPEAPAPGPVTPLPITPPNFNAAYLDNPAPVYPPLSRRSGEQGRAILRVLVTANGAADAVELRTSSGSARLDQAAIDTVKRWRFVPARQGDQAVAAWVLVPIAFSLER
jgi:protein TonB